MGQDRVKKEVLEDKHNNIVVGDIEKAKVLFEEFTVENKKKVWQGYTERYEKVTMESEEDLKNRIVEVVL